MHMKCLATLFFLFGKVFYFFLLRLYISKNCILHKFLYLLSRSAFDVFNGCWCAFGIRITHIDWVIRVTHADYTIHICYTNWLIRMTRTDWVIHMSYPD